MILVAGGTGRLGTIVVSRLAANGHDVRVFVRDPQDALRLGMPATVHLPLRNAYGQSETDPVPQAAR